ncbi:MAG: cyanoexosortase B system-associated protein [Cyanobacteria bacterium P01_H01_bin.15]
MANLDTPPTQQSNSSSPSPNQRTTSRWGRWFLLGLLSLVVFISALPGYLGQTWTWWQPPDVAIIKSLQDLRQTGLAVPGWTTDEQVIGYVGGARWSIQQVSRADNETPFLLYLLPQVYFRNQPAVEWNDIRGSQRWKIADQKAIEIQSSNLEKPAIANFFRAWSERQTFVVVQWYAWPGGGHPSTVRWFWLDQLAQLRGQRAPWIAVSIQMPINPLEDLGPYEAEIKAIALRVQDALEKGPFQGYYR